MPTGTRPEPDDFDRALAALVRMRMASRTPAMSASDLAERTGIPRATLSKLVHAKTPMTLAHIRRIAVALGTSQEQDVEQNAGKSTPTPTVPPTSEAPPPPESPMPTDPAIVVDPAPLPEPAQTVESTPEPQPEPAPPPAPEPEPEVVVPSTPLDEPVLPTSTPAPEPTPEPTRKTPVRDLLCGLLCPVLGKEA